MAIRQWSTWGLLLIWAFAFWGAHGLLWVKEHGLEQNLEARMADEKAAFVSFSILRADSARLFHWEHSREFAYQGQMYDVIERRVDGDSLHLRCYWDQAESVLKRQVRQLQQQPVMPISEAQQIGFLYWVRPCLLPEAMTTLDGYSLGMRSSFPAGYLRTDQVVLTPPHAPPNVYSLEVDG